MDKRPIGIFDSGLGGLNVLRQIKKELPNENFIYFGDTARVPYGTRSKKTIEKFALSDTKFLLEKKVKLIVVACNTVSTMSLSKIKKYANNIAVFDVMSAGVEEVIEKRSLKKLCVIGTDATIKSDMYKKLINKNARKTNLKIKVFQKGCPLLVPIIEEGELDNGFSKDIVKYYLTYAKDNNCDSLLLACTHYFVLKDIIKKIVGNEVNIIDPSQRLGKEIKNYLKLNKLQNSQKKEGTTKYFVTDITQNFNKTVSLFFKNGKQKPKLNLVSIDK